ncbi:MAG: hypothetical protein GQ573_07760 [Gammaproteobacteria bacterium]|nr:hypothetical protein [Gammaproteobacteria bacterium]
MHLYTHFNWLELLEIGLFVLLVLFFLIFIIRFFILTPSFNERPKENISFRKMHSWKKTPEYLLLVLSLPLQLLWEIAQFPLYTVWHEGDWSFILYGLVHCTFGDLLIMLCVFWLVSILNRTRYWIFSPSALNILLFTALGLTYTIFSEIINTRVKSTWGYTELMPIVPVIEIGSMPFLQWLLIPPVLIWLMQIMRPTQNL